MTARRSLAWKARRAMRRAIRRAHHVWLNMREDAAEMRRALAWRAAVEAGRRYRRTGLERDRVRFAELIREAKAGDPVMARSLVFLSHVEKAINA